MTVEYIITSELREKLKEPFGVLLEGSFGETMDKIRVLIEKEHPAALISVGDVVSVNLHEHCIHPQVTIIDNKSLRTQKIPETLTAERTVHVANPQGTITKEAKEEVKKAVSQSKHTHIVVDGEEDLLTLVAVLYAPENSFVVYGQPYRGVVVVKATPKKKAQAEKFLKEMKAFEKLNKKKTV